MAAEVRTEEAGTVDVLEFAVGPSRYGIELADVEEIVCELAIQAVPNALPCVEGLFRHRGKVCSAVNLAAYLGLEGRHERDIFILTNFRQAAVAFRVDELIRIHRLARGDIQPPDAVMESGVNGLLRGVAKLKGKRKNQMVFLLDFERVLRDIDPGRLVLEAEAEEAPGLSRGEASILLASENDELRQVLAERLYRAGFKRLTAVRGGQAAWELLRAAKGDPARLTDLARLLITDLDMPPLDGPALIRRVRKEPRLAHLPVLVFSEAISQEQSGECEKAGANAQLAQDDAVRLISTVERLLREPCE